MPYLTVDTRALKDFARDLRLAEPALYRSTRKKSRLGAMLVADQAKANASGWSTTVAQTVKVRQTGASVKVVAGGANCPIAGLADRGNKGSSSRTVFRHPVFGDEDNWVNQEMHPFLTDAMEQRGEAAIVIIADAWNEAIEIVRGTA